MIVDIALEGRHNLVCGANKADYHYRNVTPGRDFHMDAGRQIFATWSEGEACPAVSQRILKIF